MSEVQTTRFDVTKLPLHMRQKVMVSIDQRLTNGSVCWEWTGATNSKGYGQTAGGRKGKNVLAHRQAYTLLVGEIPKGLTIDHLCFNKVCVNTDHMEPVTVSENSRRRHASQTHCKSGHRLSGENLRIATRRDGYTRRVCVTCERERNRMWMRASRNEVAA